MSRLLDAAERIALRIELRRLTAVVLAIIVVLGVIGSFRFAHKDALSAFNLDGERNVPALFSGALWTCVGVLAVVVGRATAETIWYVLAGAVFLLAADEVLELHERLEHHTGVDWQVLYLPVAVLVAVLLLLIGLRLKRLGVGLGEFAAATAAGLVSQVLEQLQYDAEDQPARGYRVMVVSEELLEMVAALLLGRAFIAALRAVPARPESASA